MRPAASEPSLNSAALSWRAAGSGAPESYAEYMDRFEASYTMPATGEIAEAQETRNALRAGPRLGEGEAGIDVELSPRFCGLPYEDGPGGFDCSPDDVMAYDAEWMLKCCESAHRQPRPRAALRRQKLTGWTWR
jgi:hypothetical protein